MLYRRERRALGQLRGRANNTGINRVDHYKPIQCARPATLTMPAPRGIEHAQSVEDPYPELTPSSFNSTDIADTNSSCRSGICQKKPSIDRI